MKVLNLKLRRTAMYQVFLLFAIINAGITIQNTLLSVSGLKSSDKCRIATVKINNPKTEYSLYFFLKGIRLISIY